MKSTFFKNLFTLAIARRCSCDKQFMVTADGKLCKHYFNN